MPYQSELKTAQANVTTAGTPVQLASIPVEQAYQSLVLKAKWTNTGSICVGDSSANALKSSAFHFKLAANESVELRLANLNQIWIDSTVSGEGVEILVG